MTISEMIILYHRHKTHRLWLDHIYTDDDIVCMRKSMRGGYFKKRAYPCRYCGKMVRVGQLYCRSCRAAVKRGEIVPVKIGPYRCRVSWGPRHYELKYAYGEDELDELIKLTEESSHEPLPD